MLLLTWALICYSQVRAYLVLQQHRYSDMKLPEWLLFDSFCKNISKPVVSNECWFKGSQLDTFCPQAIVYCYIEFKLRYLENLKLFSIRVKQLFEPVYLRKKRRVLALLKAFSSETDLWVTLILSKKRKIGKGNLYLNENELSWNKIRCTADNHNYMCHTCAKEFLDSNYN